MDDAEIAKHFFEVRLKGFFNPPVECLNFISLKTFVSQIAPLPYDDAFSFRDQIANKGDEFGIRTEFVHVYLSDGNRPAVEIFKPYEDRVSVKNVRDQLVLQVFDSPTRRWWGWVGEKQFQAQ